MTAPKPRPPAPWNATGFRPFGAADAKALAEETAVFRNRLLAGHAERRRKERKPTFAGRLAAVLRALASGRVELGPGPHSPIAEADRPGHCICGLRLGHPDHGAAGPALAELLGGVDSHGPDVLVFGPQAAVEPQGRGSGSPGEPRSCALHGVTWRGGGACWRCRRSR